MFQRLASSKRNIFKPKRDDLAFGMWNTIEERVSYECMSLLMTEIVFRSSGTFLLIKSNMKSSLVKEKISLTFNNFNPDKRGPV